MLLMLISPLDNFDDNNLNIEAMDCLSDLILIFFLSNYTFKTGLGRKPFSVGFFLFLSH